MRQMKYAMSMQYLTVSVNGVQGKFKPLHKVSAFPYLPIPLGIVVDSATFGGAWWLVVLMVAWSRREMRRRRGRCAFCAYDLRGGQHEVCPECGR